jgi:anti-sigma regulatory factor (Ser/Thr protein kinase)
MVADLTLKLQPQPIAPALARRAAQDQFGGHLTRRQLDDLVLVVSELVGNAIVHGDGEVVLRLQLDGETVRGEVVDEGGGFEREVRVREPDDFGGRGLLIVESMTSRWGVHEGTTHVWFEMFGAEETADTAGPHLGAEQRPDELG